MARKTSKTNIHEFTIQIHSTKRTGTRFANMDNHDERLAKDTNALACRDCRHFHNGCSDYIGKWHKTCSEFEWW